MLDRNLVFVSGKGGVGKSAVSAAIALLGARTGRMVLALGMTDHTGIAAHLGIDHVGHDPVPAAPGLYVAAVDRARALDEYLKVQLRVPAAAPTRQLSRALNVLVDTAPGIREIVSIGKPVYETWRGRWDLIVVDAPPTGQIVSYLRAPTSIRELVPAGIVQQQAQRLEATLHAPSTGYVLVATPSELSVAETLETASQLVGDVGLPDPDVVVNRVLEPLAVTAAAVAALPAGAHREAAMLHHALWDAQEQSLQQLGHTAGSLPFLFGLLTPGEVAARLSDVVAEWW